MLSLKQFPLVVLKSAVKFLNRKNRNEDPEGEFDNGGRWYPEGKDAEVFDYSHRSPSRAYPYSYLTACRTAEHCAKLYGADVHQVRKASNIMKKMRA